MSIESAEQELRDAQQKLENIKKIKSDEQRSKFTKEVFENVQRFETLKSKIGVIKENENVTELALCIKELIGISISCIIHDYDDTPYGGFCIGPEEAHIINSNLNKESRHYRDNIETHLFELLSTNQWKKL